MSESDEITSLLGADAKIIRSTVYDKSSSALKAAQDTRVAQDIRDLETLIKQHQDAMNLVRSDFDIEPPSKLIAF